MVKPISGREGVLFILLLLLLISAQICADSSGNTTHPAAPPPPPLEKNSTAIPDDDPGKKSLADDPAANNTRAGHEEKKKPVTSDHCCGAKVVACLSSPGDASDEMYSLVVKSRDSVNVKITTPSFLHAEPAEFTTSNGQDLQVKVEVVDAEAAKVAKASNITIQSEGETCELPVPSQNPGYPVKDRFSYSTLRSPAVGFSMLALALVAVLGSWAYCRYKVNHDSRNDGSYVDVEMGLRSEYNQSAASETGSNPAAAAAAAAGISDDWNEVWDDDWNDTEDVGSSQFKLTKSLSSKGLAARKTKEWTD